jgi:RHS repeat-associated protein
MLFSAAPIFFGHSPGKERDQETGLDYFGARYYSGAQGRFMSVDPGPFTIADPQSWNRFSYVQNNPLKFVDPTGAFLSVCGRNENLTSEFIDELQAKTGLHLQVGDDGQVSIIKGTKRDNIGSKKLANLLRDIIKDKKTQVYVELAENMPGAFIDSFVNNIIDMADYRALADVVKPDGFDANDNNVFQTVNLAHVLKELYFNAKEGGGRKINYFSDFRRADDPARLFEIDVLSELTGKKQKKFTSDPRKVFGGVVYSFIYTTVTYDVWLKHGQGSQKFDTITRVEKK